ncbi:MAG: hypothetical protein QGG40_02210, partial [Myxococcota bacterium]|nr:hypothetical protein [Myxococcota bacterium]
MSAHGPDLTSIIASTPRTVPPKVKTLALVAIVLGVIATGYGFATAPDRTRTAFVTNFMYFAGICQGAFMLAAVFTVTLARWGRPLKRIAEAFGMFMPVLWLLLMIFLVTGGLDIYLWTHEEMPAHKAVWLQPGFFVARQAFNLGLLILLSALYVRASLRSDLGVIASQVGDRAPAWWGRLTANWQGEEAE